MPQMLRRMALTNIIVALNVGMKCMNVCFTHTIQSKSKVSGPASTHIYHIFTCTYVHYSNSELIISNVDESYLYLDLFSCCVQSVR